MFQYRLLKAYAKFLGVLSVLFWRVAREAAMRAEDAFSRSEDAADDAKIAARRYYEGELLTAAQEHDFNLAYAENLRTRATSVEVQSGAHYTQSCKNIRDKLVALQEETI